MDRDELITCPFDKAHRILKSRLQFHLVICKVNHPDVKMVHCVYNTTHLLQSTDFLSHLETCKDRYTLDSYVYTPQDCDRNKYPINCTSILDDDEDTWDDINLPTYNPKEYCTSNLIMRRLDCASKKNRKQFREEERRRFEQLKNEGMQYPKEEKVIGLSKLPRTEAQCLAKPFDPKFIIQKMRELVLKEKNSNTLPVQNNINTEESIEAKKEVFFAKGRGRRYFPNGV